MNRPILIAIIGVVVIALAIGLNYLSLQQDEMPSAEQAPEVSAPQTAEAPKEPVAKPEPPKPEKPAPPSFDVVRVNPQGNAVIAGRALGDSMVVIYDGGTEIGRVKADARGEWVFVPDQPLEPGSRKLSLKMLVDGFDPIPSVSDVVLIVPERDKDIAGQPGTGETLALKVSPDKPTTVLQKPGGNADFKITVDAVDYDDEGRLSISGHAQPGAVVQLYLNNRFIGHANTGPDLGTGLGSWTMTPDTQVAPGLYRLRADHVNNAGKVLARVEFPFTRSVPIKEIIEDEKKEDFIIVQPGNSLWRIARHSYGEGMDYTVIYEANKEQIRNPDLIYPGQVFKLPTSQ